MTTIEDPKVMQADSAVDLPPSHVAIIMDGNGRWASARNLPRLAGHRAGAQAVRRTIETACKMGVGWLTLYAFSSENWRRPVTEVLDLTGLLRHFLKTEIAELKKNGIRLRFIGDRQRFERDIQFDLAQAERDTESNTRLNLVVALSYGARGEIAAAARAAAEAVASGALDPNALDETAFAGFLSTSGIPDPDLLIRTSGEQRLSNFLLWQSAYSELVFVPTYWPDFDRSALETAIREYQQRERRFGGLVAQTGS
jgi:undecaprenyl diphosphate synthase